jgi:hypothetical protein
MRWLFHVLQKLVNGEKEVVTLSVRIGAASESLEHVRHMLPKGRKRIGLHCVSICLTLCVACGLFCFRWFGVLSVFLFCNWNALWQLNVKIAEQRAVVQRVALDQEALRLTIARMSAYLNGATSDGPYSAVRLSFKMTPTAKRTQCLQVSPSAKDSVWDWDDCASSSYDQQTFLYHNPTGHLRLADDPLHTRLAVGVTKGSVAIVEDEPRANEDSSSARTLSFQLPGATQPGIFGGAAGPINAKGANGRSLGCLTYHAASDDLVFSMADSSACLLFTVTDVALPKLCSKIPIGSNTKISELHALYKALAAVTKHDVPNYVFFAHGSVSERDPKTPGNLLEVRAEIDALLNSNKERRHKSSFLQQQELLFASVLMTDDKTDLVNLLHELLARMKEYLDAMSQTLQTESGQCLNRIATLNKLRAMYVKSADSMDASILPVKDSLAEDENQVKVVRQSIQSMETELTTKKTTLAQTKADLAGGLLNDPAKVLAAKKASFKSQLTSLEALRKKLSAILEKWSSEQSKVENGQKSYAAFPYEGECNDKKSWATGTVADRDTDDLALVGGCPGCVSECPVNTAQRAFKLSQCGDGGLKVSQRCQRPANKLTLKKSVQVNNKCDATGNWGVGMSGAENLIRLGGAINAVSQCPAGHVMTGWGIRECAGKAVAAPKTVTEAKFAVTLAKYKVARAQERVAAAKVENAKKSTTATQKALAKAKYALTNARSAAAAAQKAHARAVARPAKSTASKAATGLQFTLQCAFTGFKLNHREVLGKCTRSVQAWGSGTHYSFNKLSQIAAPECPEGTFVSGMGVRHCDASKSTLRFVATCSSLSTTTTKDEYEVAAAAKAAQALKKQSTATQTRKVQAKMVTSAKTAVTKALARVNKAKAAYRNSKGKARALAKKNLAAAQRSWSRAKKVLRLAKAATRPAQRAAVKSSSKKTKAKASRKMIVAQKQVMRAKTALKYAKVALRQAKGKAQIKAANQKMTKAQAALQKAKLGLKKVVKANKK